MKYQNSSNNLEDYVKPVITAVSNSFKGYGKAVLKKVMPFVIAAGVYAGAEAADYGKVTAANLNFRKNPNINAELIDKSDQLDKGEIVEYLGQEKNGWIKVKDGKGREGYASKKHLADLEEICVFSRPTGPVEKDADWEEIVWEDKIAPYLEEKGFKPEGRLFFKEFSNAIESYNKKIRQQIKKVQQKKNKIDKIKEDNRDTTDRRKLQEYAAEISVLDKSIIIDKNNCPIIFDLENNSVIFTAQEYVLSSIRTEIPGEDIVIGEYKPVKKVVEVAKIDTKPELEKQKELEDKIRAVEKEKIKEEKIEYTSLLRLEEFPIESITKIEKEVEEKLAVHLQDKGFETDAAGIAKYIQETIDTYNKESEKDKAIFEYREFTDNLQFELNEDKNELRVSVMYNKGKKEYGKWEALETFQLAKLEQMVEKEAEKEEIKRIEFEYRGKKFCTDKKGNLRKINFGFWNPNSIVMLAKEVKGKTKQELEAHIKIEYAAQMVEAEKTKKEKILDNYNKSFEKIKSYVENQKWKNADRLSERLQKKLGKYDGLEDQLAKLQQYDNTKIDPELVKIEVAEKPKDSDKLPILDIAKIEEERKEAAEVTKVAQYDKKIENNLFDCIIMQNKDFAYFRAEIKKTSKSQLTDENIKLAADTKDLLNKLVEFGMIDENRKKKIVENGGVVSYKRDGVEDAVFRWMQEGIVYQDYLTLKEAKRLEKSISKR